MKVLKRMIIILILFTVLSNYMVTINNIVYAIEENTDEMRKNMYDISVYAQVTSKFKGTFYANLNLLSKKNIDFTTTTKVNLYDIKNIDNIKVFESNFLNLKNGEKIELDDQVLYKSTSVSVEEFNTVLGENGHIEIYNEKGLTIGYISKDSNIKDDKFFCEYSEDVNRISFKLIGIINNSQISINNEKVIRAGAVFTQEQIYNMKSLEIINTSESEEIKEIDEDIINENEDDTSNNTVIENIVEQDNTVDQENIVDQENTVHDNNDNNLSNTIIEEDFENEVSDIINEVNTNEVENYINEENIETKDELEEQNQVQLETMDENQNSVTNEEKNRERVIQFFKQEGKVKKLYTENFEKTPAIDVTPEKIPAMTVASEVTENVYKSSSNLEIDLEDTQTKVEIKMDTNNLSTEENNDITFNINLKNNSEQYEVFKNPSIEVLFPHAIENVEIKNISLINRNGLSLSNWGVEKNANGENILKINLEGIQKEYNPGSVVSATTINVSTNIKVNELTASKKGNIKLKYTNEIGTITAYKALEKEYDEYEINYVSQSRLINEVEFSNFNDENETIHTINKSINIGKTEVGSTQKEATIRMNIINNFKQDIDNVVILGKLPVIGNTDGNQISLNTTVDTYLSREVITSGIIAKIYYSENINEEIDSNNWLEQVEDYRKVKCFKIVLDNKKMSQGENIEISYNIVIPENLTYNQIANGANAIHYYLNEEKRIENIIVGVETDKKEITLEDLENVEKIELDNKRNESNEKNNLQQNEIQENIEQIETQQNTEQDETEQDETEPNNDIQEETKTEDEPTEEKGLSIGTQVTRGGIVVNEGDEIDERQILRYTTIIKNTSDEAITNITIRGSANNANMFYWYTYPYVSSTSGEEVITGEWIEDTEGKHTYDEMNISSLMPGETRTFEYQVIVKKFQQIETTDKNVYGKILIKADGLEEKEIQTLKNNIRTSDIQVQLYKSGLEDVEYMYLFAGEDYNLKANVKNISNKDIKNVEVSFMLPLNVHYRNVTKLLFEEYNINLSNTSTNNIVTITLDELEPGKEETLYLYTMVDDLDLSIAETDVTVVVNVNADGRTYVSNDYTRTISQNRTDYEIEFAGNKENGATVTDKENLVYTYTVKNIGVIDDEPTITDIFPYGLDINNITLFRQDGTAEKVTSNDVEKDTQGYDGVLSYKLKIGSKETIRLQIDATVNVEKCLTDQKEINHQIELSSITEKNSVIYKIQYPEGFFEDEEKEQEKKTDNNISDDNINDNNTNNDNNNNEQEQNNYNNTDDNNKIDQTETFEENYNDTNYTKVEGEKDNKKDEAQLFNNKSSDVNSNPISVTKDNNKNETGEKSDAYNISGVVWIDKNRDGYLDDKETKGSGIKVKLFNTKNNTEIDKATTDVHGKYMFKNVEKGEYIVLFEYNNQDYTLTKYKVDESKENIISYVISEQLIDNSSYGVTDRIIISDSNIENLNMGLIRNEQFDFEIKTYVSKIKTKTKKGTEEFKFDENDLAKVELPSKYIDGAEVTATLKIRVTNKGAIDGYVDQIKDIIPEGWIFDKKLNKNWSQGSDNNIYSSELKNTLIKSNNYREITLILRKTMNGNTTGVFKNTAIINSVNNKLEIEETNKENNEDSTEIMVLIKTGMVTYIMYVLIAVAIYIILIYILNDKILKFRNAKQRKLINYILITIFVFILFVVCILNIKSKAFEVFPVGNGREGIQYWANGKMSGGGKNERIDDYMLNFYGWADTRKKLLESSLKFKYIEIESRTSMCLHNSNISSEGDIGDTTSSYSDPVSIVDVGYDNGQTPYFNRLFGDFTSGIFDDADKEPETLDFYADDYRAQTLAYLAYCSDEDLWGNGNIYLTYKYGLAYLLKDSNFKNALAKVSGIKIINANVIEGFQSGGRIDDAKDAFAEFVSSCRDTFGISKNEVNSDDIMIKAADNDELIAKKDDGYISGLRVYYPGKGHNKYVSNNTKIKCKIDNGETFVYTGPVYTRSAKRDASGAIVKNGAGKTVYEYTKYDQDSTYGLPDSLSGKNIYIKPSDISSSRFKNLKISFTNQYYTYSARLICTYRRGGEQNQGILRGIRNDVERSSVVYTLETGPGVTIDKTVASIDEIPNRTYIENGCLVTYNIRISAIGEDSIKNIKFVDSAPAGFTYVSHSSNLTGDGVNFQYNGRIEADNYVDVQITYEVTNATNPQNTTTPFTNKVTITYVDDGTANVTLYNASTGFNEAISDSVFTSSADVFMKKYNVTISKTASGTAFEKGDTFNYTIQITNNGESGSYGNIKKLVIQDTIPAQLDFISATGSNWVENSDGTYTYSKNLSPGNTTEALTITVKVNSAKYEVVRNTVKITEVYNHEDVNVYSETKGKLTDHVDVIIKGYSISISKNADGTVYEAGDTVVFTIVVKNTGTSDTHGALKNLIIYDVLPPKLDLISATGSGWSSDGNGNYSYSGALQPGESTTELKISGLVTSGKAGTATNTAKVTQIYNKNNYDITSDATGKKEDSATIKILGYKVYLNKYVDGVWGEVQGRQNLSEEQKEANPVKVEVGDEVSFCIVLKNDGIEGEHGNVKNITLTDTIKCNGEDNECLKLLRIQPQGGEVSSGSNNVWTSGDWTVSTTNNINFTINYSNTLTLQQEVKLYVCFEVIHRSLTNDILQNDVYVKNAQNKNNFNLGGYDKDNLEGKLISIDYLKYLKYKVGVEKTVTSIVDNEGNTYEYNRLNNTNDNKYNYPVEVEKGYTVSYKITIQNLDETNLKNFVLDDIYEGISFSNSDISITIGTTPINPTITNEEGKCRLVISENLAPNEIITITIKAKVTITNLRLLNCANRLEITSVMNKNNVYVRNTEIEDLYQILNYEYNNNIDYVRLKDLIISGTVWNDNDRDGYINNGEKGIPNLTVKLYDVTNNKVATTVTNQEGKYKFGKVDGMISEDGRVVKATDKDPFGNYTEQSQYIQYYVEFVYNGTRYISTQYANMSNLNLSDYSYNENYLTDSNAAEFTADREAFEDMVGTIAYNKMIGKDNTGIDISYDKKGHLSTLKDIDANSILTMQARSFINVDGTASDGLQSNDINYLWLNSSIGHDGETEYLKYINLGLLVREMDLKLEQDVYKIRTTINGQEFIYNYNQGKIQNSGFNGSYVTGGESSPRNYQFLLYHSDYDYRNTQYQNEDVVIYKENTELNVDVIYKITLSSENTASDITNVYSVINEVANFYSSNFVKFDPNNNSKTIKLDEKDGVTDGILENVTETITEAWFYDQSNVKRNLKIKNNTSYPVSNEGKNFAGYNKIFIDGFENYSDWTLGKGESKEFYIKFTVAKDSSNNDNLKIGSENSIAEINAYTTYEDRNKTDLAGYIDINSNPGNVGLNPANNTFDSPENYSLYENDAYKTGVDINLKDLPPDNPDPEYEEYTERTLTGFVWDDARSEELKESGKGTQYIGDGIYDTSKNKVVEAKSNLKLKDYSVAKNEDKDIPVKDAKATLVELVDVPISGQIKTYEETINSHMVDTTDENGKYMITSFIPGKYIVKFDYGYSNPKDEAKINVAIFNGHDYKSTTFNPELNKNVINDINVNSAEGDKILNILTNTGSSYNQKYSDARDDEIRRLEVISYSEDMNNEKTKILKENANDEELFKNTGMYAETVAFPVRTEQLPYGQTELSYENYNEIYDQFLKVVKTTRYSLKNIDFGIEYRPELNVELNKFISNIKVKLSTGEDLFNIVYKKIYEDNDQQKRVIKTEIDMDKSKGSENVQYLPSTDNAKGFGYFNVDTDLLQGCTIEIQYLFITRNKGETDRISKNLNDIRYKENDATKTLQAQAGANIFEETYTASGTAANELEAKYYGNNKQYRTLIKQAKEYYGKYLGSTYFTGQINSNYYTTTPDVVAETKVSGILDYVDNDLVFETSNNSGENNFWKASSSSELLSSVDSNVFRKITNESGVEEMALVDNQNRRFDDNTHSNLAVSVDDQVSDSDTNNKNKLLSKFLLPEIEGAGSEENNRKSFGTIELLVNKTVASEDDTANMKYDNIAEIISYRSLTGRVTTLKTDKSTTGTTIGNLDIPEIPEDPNAPGSTPPGNSGEDDTSTTETILLSPPTGRYRANYYIRRYQKTITTLAIIIIVITVTTLIIRKIIKYKKFYK